MYRGRYHKMSVLHVVIVTLRADVVAASLLLISLLVKFGNWP